MVETKSEQLMIPLLLDIPVNLARIETLTTIDIVQVLPSGYDMVLYGVSSVKLASN
jgi:hypothetical protein